MTADDIVPPQTSLEVRDRLVRALRLDLVGPGPADSSSSGYDYAAERLPGRVRPSVWYLTGFLIPSDAPLEQRSDVDEDERLDEVPESAGSADEDSGGEQPAARRGFLSAPIRIYRPAGGYRHRSRFRTLLSGIRRRRCRFRSGRFRSPL